MSKKVLLIIFTTLIIIIGAGSYFIFWNNEAEVHLAEEKTIVHMWNASARNF